MIKIRRGSTIILGLSAENIKRLQVDPIRFDGAQIGLPNFTFFIVTGETEQALAERWAPDEAETVKAFMEKENAKRKREAAQADGSSVHEPGDRKETGH
jgi:hypothetical protein